ncbi:MAG TPA: MFS transporter, partial [Planctomycetaceae bacterium]
MSSERPAGHQTDTPPLDVREGLSSRSFVCLVVAQALGTLNDNMFRWLAVPVATHMLGGTEHAKTAALSWGIFWFTLPYLLLPTHAGWLADRFSKRSVIVWCKAAEIVVMLLGIAAIFSASAAWLFAALFLMGTQAALFAPSKFGSIPEILRTDKLSAGNGIMAMVTVMAAAAGTVAGFELFVATQPDGIHDIWITAVVLTAVGIAGWAASLGIRPHPAGRPDYPMPKDPVTQNWKQLKLLASHRSLMRAALGIAFFYALATLTQANIKLYGESVLHLDERNIGPLMLALVFGVGLGSVLAGIWSGGRVELGIV